MMNVYMGADVEDFIFGESTSYESNEVDNVTDEEMNAEGVIECFDDPDVACYRIALENEQNYHAIMSAMMEREIGVLEATGEEMVYEASKVKEFFGWIKKQIQKFWAKVQGVFKKVMDTLTSFVLSNKAFVKKYRPYASQMKKPKEKKDFEGYDFGNLVIKYNQVADNIKADKSDYMAQLGSSDLHKTVNDQQDKREYNNKRISRWRGIICDTNSVSADEFDQKIREKLYGSLKPHKLTIKDFSYYLNQLETAAENKKDANNGYKEAKDSVKKLTGIVKEAEKELNNRDGMSDKAKENVSKVARNITDMISSCLTLMGSALSYQTRAIVAKAQQDRKIANWYVTGQAALKAKNESAIDDDLAINLI